MTPAIDVVAETCAVCGQDAKLLLEGKNLYQVKCVTGRHRTRFYLDADSAIQAWRVNQRHKRSQGTPHG